MIIKEYNIFKKIFKSLFEKSLKFIQGDKEFEILTSLTKSQPHNTSYIHIKFKGLKFVLEVHGDWISIFPKEKDIILDKNRYAPYSTSMRGVKDILNEIVKGRKIISDFSENLTKDDLTDLLFEISDECTTIVKDLDSEVLSIRKIKYICLVYEIHISGDVCILQHKIKEFFERVTTEWDVVPTIWINGYEIDIDMIKSLNHPSLAQEFTIKLYHNTEIIPQPYKPHPWHR